MTNYTEREMREIMDRRMRQIRLDHIVEVSVFCVISAGIGAMLVWWFK